MLQIRLSKAPAAEGVGGAKPLPVESVTVACPDHLVLAELPVAKGIGAATSASLVKTVGRRSRRPLGERVHFCVRCDFPVAIYGRLVLTLFSWLPLNFLFHNDGLYSDMFYIKFHFLALFLIQGFFFPKE